VWQESHGGAITFYHTNAEGEVMEFHQWKKTGPVFFKLPSGIFAQVQPAGDTWQHTNVEDWAEATVAEAVIES
jgi:hypothetical protein